MIIPLINPSHSRRKPTPFRLSQAKLARAYRQALKRFTIKRNPRRPPKEWFYRKVAELARTGRYADPQRMAGHLWYHQASPSRKREIMSEERPAVSRGFHNPSKELPMVYSLIKRPRRRRAHRRRRRNPSFGLHRPTLLYAGKWFRRKRSKLIHKGTRINPRRRYRRKYRLNAPALRSRRSFRFRRYRRNPAIPFNLVNVAIGGAKIGGGIVAGALLMPVYNKFMPAGMTAQFGRYYGVLNIVVGALLASFIKNRMIKDAAIVVAGTGVYDLIASNVGMLNLPPLPRTLPALGLGADEPGVIGVGASYQQIGRDFAPALGASYQDGEDDIAYGGDEIEIG